MNSIKEILERVAKEVTPKKNEIILIDREVSDIRNKLENELKAKKIDAKVLIAGSYAKNTWLSKNHDVDIFMIFNKKYKEENISELMLSVAKNVLKNYLILHGTRNYIKYYGKNVKIDLVPVMEINSPSLAENSIDASPFHVQYVSNKIKERPSLAREIRILKQFLKAQKIYGAESYINGISGYVSELLMIYYGSFERFLDACEQMKPKIIIDIEKHYSNEKDIFEVLSKSKTSSPLIVIDPVYKERNACASLSYDVFSKMILAARLFKRMPSYSFFKIVRDEFSEIKRRSKARGTILIFNQLNAEKRKNDVFMAKVEKKLKIVSSKLTKEGISVYDKGLTNNPLGVFIEIETLALSKMKKHLGPPVWVNSDYFYSFIKKWKKVYVSGTLLSADVKRNFPDIEKYVYKLLKSELKNV